MYKNYSIKLYQHRGHGTLNVVALMSPRRVKFTPPKNYQYFKMVLFSHILITPPI